MSFGSTGYPIFNGGSSDIGVGLHPDSSDNGSIQLFSNPAAALSAFSAPTGLQTGISLFFRA